MNILILTSLYPPLGHSGHDERCHQAVRCLARNGHKVQVLTSNHRLPPSGAISETGVLRQLVLHQDSLNEEMLDSNYQAILDHELGNAEILSSRLNRFKPSVVWVWNMRGLSKSLLFQLQNAGCAVVFDLHSDWIDPEVFEDDPWFRFWNEDQGTLGQLRKGFIEFSRKIGIRKEMLPIGRANELDLSLSYLCSESLRMQLAEAGLPDVQSLPVIYPFVDERTLTVKSQHESGGARFMWAGRLSEEKAPEIALEAVKLLSEEGLQVSLDIFAMGRPIELKEIRYKIEKMGMRDLVRMHNSRPDELADQFQNFDAFLLTSHKTDPFPMIALQAVFSKLPCILANSGGLYELVGEVDGLIDFVDGDSASLASAMQRFRELEDGGRDLIEECILRLRCSGAFEKLRDHVESAVNGS